MTYYNNIDEVLKELRLPYNELKERIDNAVIKKEQKIARTNDNSIRLKLIINIKKLNLPIKLGIDKTIELLEKYFSYETETNITFETKPKNNKLFFSKVITLSTNPYEHETAKDIISIILFFIIFIGTWSCLIFLYYSYILYIVINIFEISRNRF